MLLSTRLNAVAVLATAALGVAALAPVASAVPSAASPTPTTTASSKPSPTPTTTASGKPSATPSATPTGSASTSPGLKPSSGGALLTVEARGGNSVHLASDWTMWKENGIGDGGGIVKWDFGDGKTRTEKIAPYAIDGTVQTDYTYAAKGKYTITVTVINDTNYYVTDKATVQVGNRIALSSFALKANNTYGDPELGGPWKTSPGIDAAKWKGGQMKLSKPGVAESASMQNTWFQDVDAKVLFRSDPVEGKEMITVTGRQRTNGYYAAKLSYPGGFAATPTLTLIKLVNGVETPLASVPVRGNTNQAFAAAKLYWGYNGNSSYIRLQVSTEGGKTVLRAKAWPAAYSTEREPKWLVTAVDNDPALQRPGQIGLAGYISRTAPDIDRTLYFSQFEATAPGGLD